MPDGIECFLDVEEDCKGGMTSFESIFGLLGQEEDGIVGGSFGPESELVGAEDVVRFAEIQDAAGDDFFHQFADDWKEGNWPQIGREMMGLVWLRD